MVNTFGGGIGQKNKATSHMRRGMKLVAGLHCAITCDCRAAPNAIHCSVNGGAFGNLITFDRLI